MEPEFLAFRVDFLFPFCRIPSKFKVLVPSCSGASLFSQKTLEINGWAFLFLAGLFLSLQTPKQPQALHTTK